MGKNLRAMTEEFDHYFIPSLKPSKRLMIVLHGRGDSLKPFKTIQEELGLESMNYLLLNAPRKYDGGYTWYGFPPRQAKGVLKARRKLNILMEELEEQGWKTKDVFFFGFSQGSLVSVDFGMTYGKPLGGIIAISGYVYFFPQWRRKIKAQAFKTKWLMTHGIQDDALDIESSRICAQKLKDAGLPIKWMEFNKDHEIDEVEEVPSIQKFVGLRG